VRPSPRGEATERAAVALEVFIDLLARLNGPNGIAPLPVVARITDERVTSDGLRSFDIERLRHRWHGAWLLTAATAGEDIATRIKNCLQS
jgi:hypothetical protein